jgi:peptidoglycan/xylan/chitin deacetylase (PgdA/CDA1 family)
MWDSPSNRFLYRASLGAIAALAQVLHRRGQLILSLHSVTAQRDDGRQPASGLSITDRFLDDLIVDCARKAIPIVSLTEAIRRRHARDREPFLVITFDDGYRDLYINGFPVFERHSVPFAIFVTTGLVDRTVPMWWNALEQALARADVFHLPDGSVPCRRYRQKNLTFQIVARQFRASPAEFQRRLLEQLAASNDSLCLDDAYETSLDWSMLRTMHAGGLAEIACHSVTHPVFSGLEPEALRSEIVLCRERIREMMDLEPLYFAYPFGQDHEVGPHAPRIVEACGFKAAFTTDNRLFSSHSPLGDDHALPRIVLSKKGEDLMALQAYMSGLPQSLCRLLAA